MITQLPPDQLDQTTPVLGSLARLLARGLSPTEQELRTLLRSAGLEPEPELLAEISHWANLLRRVRDEPSDLMQSTTEEALVLRGLTEAPAVLAVATVAGAMSAPLPVSPVRSPTLIVLSDGSGTHGSLAEAVAAAAPGATILLERGVHRLSRGLLLPRAVTLAGEGMDITEVVAEQGDYVLGYGASGRLRLADLAVRWAGPPHRSVHVVSVWHGDMQIERCRLIGAPASDSWAGAGLDIAGKVGGTVRWCRVEANGSGIEIQGEAAPVLENNVCSGNGWFGIRYREQSSGLARWNVCSDSGHDGIAVEQGAQPSLEGNTVHGNGWSGIGFYGPGDASARQNRCRDNGHSGIYVGAEARPLVQANDCRENQDSGICYVGSAGGTARMNACTRNQKYGICVSEQAKPLLDGNECRENRDSGIAYFGLSAGMARHNRTHGNQHYGIYLGVHAHPALQANTSQSNGRSMRCV